MNYVFGWLQQRGMLSKLTTTPMDFALSRPGTGNISFPLQSHSLASKGYKSRIPLRVSKTPWLAVALADRLAAIALSCELVVEMEAGPGVLAGTPHYYPSVSNNFHLAAINHGIIVKTW